LARDYRHGVQPKKAYQRKSQLNQPEAAAAEGLTGKQLSLLMVSLGLVIFAGYLVVSHFMHAGVRSEKLQPRDHADKAQTVQSTPVSQKSEPTEPSVERSQKAQDKVPATEKKVVEALPVPKAPEKVHYTFYHGLAKTEVVVDAEPLPVKLPQPYYIQAGSFGSETVAKKEQARLKRFGFETQLSSLKGEKRTYYRLRLGPFFDRLQMNKVRNQLRDVGVDTLLVKASIKTLKVNASSSQTKTLSPTSDEDKKKPAID